MESPGRHKQTGKTRKLTWYLRCYRCSATERVISTLNQLRVQRWNILFRFSIGLPWVVLWLSWQPCQSLSSSPVISQCALPFCTVASRAGFYRRSNQKWPLTAGCFQAGEWRASSLDGRRINRWNIAIYISVRVCFRECCESWRAIVNR